MAEINAKVEYDNLLGFFSVTQLNILLSLNKFKSCLISLKDTLLNPYKDSVLFK